MIYKLLIGCVIILAFIYYVSIIAQLLFPKYVSITKKKINFLLAVIPFYYWVFGNENELTKK